MRGTAFRPQISIQQARFIPAYAGNSRTAGCSGGAFPVHPRVCGEQRFSVCLTNRLHGSSPRMRGTGNYFEYANKKNRFIPAYAGNRISRLNGFKLKAVHPRVCGEQLDLTNSEKISFGSSPRMRGTVCNIWQHCFAGRFIPAYAGNRKSITLPIGCESVHPRVCGEQFWIKAIDLTRNGSSPRMRGTESWFVSIKNPARFIPAYAGNSYVNDSFNNSVSVHPRVCGEQTTASIRIGNNIGSSPRMRGTD